MKFAKGGSLIRLVAFFVIAAVLTCTATFAASGWQSFLPNEPDSDNAAGDMPDGEVDENTDGQDENKEEVIPPPEIKHYLTGITVSADKANAAPISFIYGANVFLPLLCSSVYSTMCFNTSKLANGSPP